MLEQYEYASALKPVPAAAMASFKDSDSLNEKLHACFLTLLGAAAWLLQTRLDIMIYVSSLQRMSKKPTIVELKRINRLIRYVQQHPRRLRYRKLSVPIHVVAVGDSAFQAPSAEAQAVDPLVMRGYVIGIAHYESDGTVANTSGTYNIQILAYAGGKQNHVCRGVCAAEVHNQCDMLDMATTLLGFLEEVRTGPQPAARLKDLRENGGYSTPLDAFTDSGSLFSYLEADHLKFPADKGTFFHLAYLRELLTNGVLRDYFWIDTRDMCVDGMTKGRLDRQTLHQLMAGLWRLRHASKSIRSVKWQAERRST